MKNTDNEDVFADFEQKVKGKKEKELKESKEPKKEQKKQEEKLSEKEILMKKFEAEKKALRQKYDSEMKVLEEKESKEAREKETPKPKNTERIIYLSVIVVLLGMLVYFFFFNNNSGESAEKSTEETIIEEINDTSEENATLGTELKKEPPKNESAKTEEKKEDKKEEKQVSGKVTLTIDKVHYEKSDADGNLSYITQVDFTIINDRNKVLSPVLDVFIFDDETKESWEFRSRGKYTYPIGIKSGAKHSDSITVTPKTFRNPELEKKIRLALNDTGSGFITAINDAITIS